MAVMKELINTSYLFGNDSTKFADKFRKTVKASSTNNRFWENIEHYANGCYNNALNRIKEKFPDLREHEMKFVCLLLCGFSTVEIMVCMGFTNEHSIGNKRLAVAKKMGIDIPLEEYLATYKSEIPS